MSGVEIREVLRRVGNDGTPNVTAVCDRESSPDEFSAMKLNGITGYQCPVGGTRSPESHGWDSRDQGGSGGPVSWVALVAIILLVLLLVLVAGWAISHTLGPVNSEILARIRGGG